MGIEAFAERARHELMATGDTVRKRTVETVSELTDQEEHIARLAVNGRTNVEIGTQLFLSTRTVEWHLSKVYTKLGVGSRRELRRHWLAWGGQARRSSAPARKFAGVVPACLRAPRVGASDSPCCRRCRAAGVGRAGAGQVPAGCGP